MRLVLATGIYPPDIGGPATYVRALAEELEKKGIEVTVVTYEPSIKYQVLSIKQAEKKPWRVVLVSKRGGPIGRWLRYAKALRQQGRDADAVIAFSSVSAGVPLWLSSLGGARDDKRKPKKILRLGGDFFWERYTDHGGMLGLRDWYKSMHYSLRTTHWLMQRLLNHFDHLVFSTKLQEEIYEKHYRRLPPHLVIENALPTPSVAPVTHTQHEPFRLLFMGRFVGFKNLFSLIRALPALPEVTLTLVGDGPLKMKLRRLGEQLGLNHRIVFTPPVGTEEKQEIFALHDLLVLPSLTEISPNVALEARAAGLPVLLSKETGLSSSLHEGMLLRELETPENIAHAIKEVQRDYNALAEKILTPFSRGTWSQTAEKYLQLLDVQ